jgi:hypothetical protein
MLRDIDIWRAAHLLMKQHGGDAVFEAAQRSDDMLARGDLEGAAVWRAIRRAIEDLARQELRKGERLN